MGGVVGEPVRVLWVEAIVIIPQQPVRLWGLQSVKQRRGDWGFGSRVPDSVRDVCALKCRNWIWRPQVKIIYLWGAARDCSSLFDGTFAHGGRSKCAHSVRTHQCCRMNRSSCGRREIQVCSRRENAAVFSPEHVSLRTEKDPSVLTACEFSSVVA